MNIINRLNEDFFLETILEASRDVILVQGARQVGKTTFVEKILKGRKNCLMFNLERDLDFLRDIDRSQSFKEFSEVIQQKVGTLSFDQPESILYIDEAQESEKIGSYVRFMKEEWKHIKVILSGSSMGRIFRNTQRIPVGRFKTWLITPLTFEEFLPATSDSLLTEVLLRFTDKPQVGLAEASIHDSFLNKYDEYLIVGGLPAVVSSYLRSEDYEAQRRFILNAQEDDFVRKSSLSERILFSRGMKGVANFIGMPSKKSQIHDSPSVSERILSELVAWNLIIEIEQKSNNSTTSHLPKRYLYDLGMAQDLREMPFPRLSLVSTQNPILRTQLGGLFENAVLIQLIAEKTYLDSISGWKKGTSASSEIDFVIRFEHHTIPIECKASRNVSTKNLTSIVSYLELTGQKLGFLVSAAPFKVIHRGKFILVNLPIYFATRKNIISLAKKFLD